MCRIFVTRIEHLVHVMHVVSDVFLRGKVGLSQVSMDPPVWCVCMSFYTLYVYYWMGVCAQFLFVPGY